MMKKAKLVETDEFIEEVPSFEELYSLRQQVDIVIDMINALAEGHDVVQRATDLSISVDNLKRSTNQLVKVQN